MCRATSTSHRTGRNQSRSEHGWPIARRIPSCRKPCTKRAKCFCVPTTSRSRHCITPASTMCLLVHYSKFGRRLFLLRIGCRLLFLCRLFLFFVDLFAVEGKIHRIGLEVECNSERFLDLRDRDNV